MERFRYLFISIIIVSISCKKPYEPTVISTSASYLVIEGVINAGTDSTFIKLSRTVKLNSKASSTPELNATVSVQGDQNISYPFVEIGNGIYGCAGLNLDNTHQYRLDIKTAENKEYQSDYVAVLNSPPIDSISYDTKGTSTGAGVNIYSSTHDPANKVQYYRWDYQETWQFHSNFDSYFESNGDTVLGRNMITDNIYDCWQNDTSSTIIIASTAKLAKSVILNNPITSVVSTSEKVETEYSILVKQYALTPDAYNFYANVKKNTEQLGSIFDAQPSEISGNIHCVTNPAEPVIGYISVGSVATQRIFISNRQLPGWETIPFYTNCFLELGPKQPCCYYNFEGINQVDYYFNYNISGVTTGFIPIDAIGVPGSPPIGYTASTKECVDCTLRGTNKRPAFWQ